MAHEMSALDLGYQWTDNALTLGIKDYLSIIGTIMKKEYGNEDQGKQFLEAVYWMVRTRA
jgi:hypothetical protein